MYSCIKRYIRINKYVSFKLNDNELIVLLKDNSHAAYAELYQRYYRLLFVHAYKRLKDEEQAKDIVQEFFVSLWDKGTHRSNKNDTKKRKWNNPGFA
jgi:DNA-directed RNA polymerase specialized sigma24 family protein